jgi:hypothetical protein
MSIASGMRMHPFEVVRPEPSRERTGIRRMHQQLHPTHAPRISPAFYRVLPAEIPDAHPVFTETPNVMHVECAFGSPAEDRMCAETPRSG